MKHRVDLIAAPTGVQPGGYVAKAYVGRDQAITPWLELEVARPPGGWRIRLAWPCPEPVRDVSEDPSLFSDAAALLSPGVEGAPWVTMGAPGQAVEGLLWRADSQALRSVRAEGLGTLKRDDAPKGWSARGVWQQGIWRLDLTLRGWPALDASGQIAAAVWRGAGRERGGLKSVTPGWRPVTT